MAIPLGKLPDEMPAQPRHSCIQFVGAVKYAPSRDIVYIWPDVVRNIGDRLTDKKFQPLHDWLDEAGVTMEDLAEAQRCYCLFMNTSHQEQFQTMFQALEASGWNQTKWQARVALMFYGGMIMAGTFFHGIRHALSEGQETLPSIRELVDAGRSLDAWAAMPAWQRWLCLKFRWLRRLFFRTRAITTPF